MKSFALAFLLAAVCVPLAFVVCAGQQDPNQTQQSPQVTIVPLRHAGPTKRHDEMNPNPPQNNDHRFEKEKLTFLNERYQLVRRFPGLSYCDPDAYPVEHPIYDRAIQAFPEIQSDRPAFEAIAKHLDLDKVLQFSDAQKVLFYREYKKLRFAIRFEQQDDQLEFSLSAYDPPDKKTRIPHGYRITD